MSETRKLTEIIYRDDLYPRLKPEPAKIQEYAENIDRLPPIEIDQHNILIDGYHRLKAHETAKLDEISCIITNVQSEAELERLSVERNNDPHLPMRPEDKKKFALKWYGQHPDAICNTLMISRKTFDRWTSARREAEEEATKRKIFEMWSSCHTQQEIADAVGMSIGTINGFAEKFKNGHLSDIENFRNFEAEIYTTWNFGKATNEVKHFGNIPPEIIDNLMWFYTKPFDIVFDPFGGGGSTIDKCIERNRRYYVSDLTPIPARNDIRQWDITQGLPGDLPVPDLVFLDPPYWKQAEGKYSDKPEDLSNIDLDKFINVIGDLAKSIKRKWGGNRPNGKLAIIIGPYQKDWITTDLPFMCYQVISKYLKPVIRIQVPYSTQVHGGQYVTNAKESRHLLYLSRDLMVFEDVGK